MRYCELVVIRAWYQLIGIKHRGFIYSISSTMTMWMQVVKGSQFPKSQLNIQGPHFSDMPETPTLLS